MRSHPKSTLWQWFFIVAALEAGAAFVALVRVPGEQGGFSPARVGLLGVLGLLAAAALYAALRQPRLMEAAARPGFALMGFGAAFLIAVTLFLLRYLAPEQSLPYYHRLSPLLWYLLAVAIEAAVCSLVERCGLRLSALREEAAVWRGAGVALAALLAVYAFVAITKVGLTPDSAYWAEPGVPVLGWQLGLAVVATGALFFMGGRLLRLRRIDLVLGAGLWLLAVILWLSVPSTVMKNSF